MTHHVAKIIEIIGSSENGWEDAAQVAVDEAKKSLHGIHGIEVVDMTAHVDPTSGKITKYRTCVKNIFCRRLVPECVTYLDSIEVENPIDGWRSQLENITVDS